MIKEKLTAIHKDVEINFYDESASFAYMKIAFSLLHGVIARMVNLGITP